MVLCSVHHTICCALIICYTAGCWFGSRGGEEGRDTLACAIELAHVQTHASYREVRSPCASCARCCS